MGVELVDECGELCPCECSLGLNGFRQTEVVVQTLHGLGISTTTNQNTEIMLSIVVGHTRHEPGQGCDLVRSSIPHEQTTQLMLSGRNEWTQPDGRAVVEIVGMMGGVGTTCANSQGKELEGWHNGIELECSTLLSCSSSRLTSLDINTVTADSTGRGVTDEATS
jgi:hypothetical protein